MGPSWCATTFASFPEVPAAEGRGSATGKSGDGRSAQTTLKLREFCARGQFLPVSETWTVQAQRRITEVTNAFGDDSANGLEVGHRHAWLLDIEERCPIAHQQHTLFEKIAAPIGRLDLVAYRVSECHLGDLAGVVGVFGSPMTKGAAKCVRGGIHLHSSQHRRQAHVRQRLAHARKYKVTSPSHRQRAQQLQRRLREGDTVLSAGLHPRRRHSPQGRGYVQL